MKTLKKNDTIVRVSDEEAELKLRQGYKFCPKNLYKENVRDVKKEQIVKEEVLDEVKNKEKIKSEKAEKENRKRENREKKKRR